MASLTTVGGTLVGVKSMMKSKIKCMTLVEALAHYAICLHLY